MNLLKRVSMYHNGRTMNTDLVYEHHARNYFRHSLIDVTLNHFVHFPPQFVVTSVLPVLTRLPITLMVSCPL